VTHDHHIVVAATKAHANHISVGVKRRQGFITWQIHRDHVMACPPERGASISQYHAPGTSANVVMRSR